jgi:hypothetical protein
MAAAEKLEYPYTGGVTASRSSATRDAQKEALRINDMKTTERGSGIGLCDICQQRALVRRLARDHDHSNGKWRGQLCARCNMGLGHFKDKPKRLRRAAEYLDFWKMLHNGDTDCTFDEYACRVS